MKSVLVITPTDPSGPPTQGALLGMKLHEAGTTVRILSGARSGIGRAADIVCRGSRSVLRSDAVLVNSFGGRAFVYESLIILYASFTNRRTVVVLRSGRIPEFVARWPRWTRAVFSRADMIIAPHDFIREALVAWDVPVHAIIPNFIELDRYEYRERSEIAPKFLYMRGMHPNYNPIMALRAFAFVQQRYPEACLTMAGAEGELSTECRTLVRALHLRNVRFAGLVPKALISALAAQHDIHLHTNRVENMPLSVIEMWACGLPVIGTTVGGMPYLVRDGLDGVLVRSEDYHSMAESCFSLLSDTDLVRRLSRAGRARAEELSWERVRPAWESALGLSVHPATPTPRLLPTLP